MVKRKKASQARIKELPPTVGYLPFGAAYDAGRLLNQARWHFEQAYALGNEEEWRKAKTSLTRLISKLIGIVDAPGKTRSIKKEIERFLQEEEGYFYSESFGEELHRIRQVLKEGGHKTGQQVLDEFFPLLGNHSSFQIQIDGPVRELINHDLSVEMWFELGETVDQGLHPPEVVTQLFSWERDPRFPQPEMSEFGARHTPEMTSWPMWKLVFHSREAGELQPPSGWVEQVQIRLQRFEIPVGLVGFQPRAQEIPEIIKRIDASVAKGLARFAKEDRSATQGSSTWLTVKDASQMLDVEASTVSRAATKGKLISEGKGRRRRISLASVKDYKLARANREARPESAGEVQEKLNRATGP